MINNVCVLRCTKEVSSVFKHTKRTVADIRSLNFKVQILK